jgi:Flp pilus assembly protein TadG
MRMKARGKPFPTAQAGVALVEFAIALPLLMLLLIGLIEIGRLAYFGIEVGNAAHAGAHYGALSPTSTTQGMHDAAISDGQNSISNLTATANYVCACWNSATAAETPSTPTVAACAQPCSTGGNKVTYAQVTAQGTINSMFNYHALGLPASWTVSRTAIIRVVQ